MNQKILIIIPAYNEEKNIISLTNQLKQINNIDFIVINDGSTDDTNQLLEHNNINHIHLPLNLGIGGAMQTGYKYAYLNNYDIAIQLDGDGQHNPNDIEKLINSLDNNTDMVIGSRYIEMKGFQSTKLRKIGIYYLRFLCRLLTNKEIKDITSGFRACNKKTIKFFANNYPHDYPEPDTIVKLLKLNFKIKEIPVIMNARQSGSSSIRMFKSFYYIIKVSIAMIISAISPKS